MVLGFKSIDGHGMNGDGDKRTVPDCNAENYTF